ncbi:MAG: nuclear transport factor 2 family protein [Gemmatimonadota bacterium]|nr:nuclear transport factor 2 family protein [Gemmatimonadota bacterium]
MRTFRLLLIVLTASTACAALSDPAPLAAQTPEQTRLAAEVRTAERAFARSMADRDHAAFTSFLAEEAVFFTGAEPLRGREAVAAGWRPFFDGPEAPFSWEPETVEVLPSGTLALSSGPVRAPDGTRSGTFNSVWRLDADGRWRVVFDKGCP